MTELKARGGATMTYFVPYRALLCLWLAALSFYDMKTEADEQRRLGFFSLSDSPTHVTIRQHFAVSPRRPAPNGREPAGPPSPKTGHRHLRRVNAGSWRAQRNHIPLYTNDILLSLLVKSLKD